MWFVDHPTDSFSIVLKATGSRTFFGYRTGENPSVVADDEDGLELSHLLMAWGHLAGR